MNWFRYVFLALILVCAVSLLSLLAPDSKSSDGRFRIYIASVVAVGAIICVLFQALVPTSIESAGEKTEVAGTHSLASLKTESTYRAQRRFLSDTLPQPMSTPDGEAR